MNYSQIATRLLTQASRSTTNSEAIGKTASELLRSLEKETKPMRASAPLPRLHSPIISRTVLQQYFIESSGQASMMLQ